MTDHWAEGGEGSAGSRATPSMAACEQPKDFKFLYDLDMHDPRRRSRSIAKKVYGADGVDVPASRPGAPDQGRTRDLGYDKLPICMAKTHLSALAPEPKRKGVPTELHASRSARSARASAPASSIPLCGEHDARCPACPRKPAFENVDIDPETGKVRGLF